MQKACSFRWFDKCFMKVSNNKCHFFLTASQKNRDIIENTKSWKLPWLNLDLEKTSLRNTLPRVFEIHILPHVNITQRKLTVKDFLDSRSGYWALVWFVFSQQLIIKLTKSKNRLSEFSTKVMSQYLPIYLNKTEICWSSKPNI